MTVITSARVISAFGLKYSLPPLDEPCMMPAAETARTAPRAQEAMLPSSANDVAPVPAVSSPSRRAMVVANS